MTTLFSRWKRSSRKVPARTISARSLFVAAMTRTSTRRALVRAEGTELVALQDAEELGLDGDRDLGDLVEEDRPAVGLLEQPALVPVGAR